MMTVGVLKQILEAIPESLPILIDGNWNGVEIESVTVHIEDSAWVDLRLNEGWSVTKDSVIESLIDPCFREMAQTVRNQEGQK